MVALGLLLQGDIISSILPTTWIYYMTAQLIKHIDSLARDNIDVSCDILTYRQN